MLTTSQITKNMTTSMINRTAVKIRSTVFAQVTRKVIHLPLSKAEKSTALTHISADVEGINVAVNVLPDTFVAPFYLGVALYALYLVVGKVVSLAVIPCTRKSRIALEFSECTISDYYSSIPHLHDCYDALCSQGHEALERWH